MKSPAIRRSHAPRQQRCRERGITMVLVAIAMVAIIAMAALSIDVVTLYLAREEAQRSADAAALAAARLISLSGITGDPTNGTGNWQLICGGTTSPASVVAQTVAQQNAVGNIAAGSITVTYSAGSGSTITSNTDCSQLATTAFGVNPMVTVQLTRASLPTFFSRIWGNKGNSVSATATAEVFNPSNSGNVGNQTTGSIIPVQPRCVKPWVVPNLDPLNPFTAGETCTTTTGTTRCNPFVDPSDGHIVNAGISLNGGPAPNTGVIGERFILIPDCRHRTTGYCEVRDAPIQANHGTNGSWIPAPPNLEFFPGQTLNASAAVPSTASSGDLYEQAVAGCDQTTIYYCGVASSSPIGSGPNMVDLNENPRNDTTNGVMALTNESNPNPNGGQPDGQDTLNPYAQPSSYPFQIFPGTKNPLGLAGTSPITASNSIVSVPIYDPANPIANNSSTSPVTIVGFLQVFINAVDQYGNVDVTVLNVAGCSNGAAGNTDPVGTAVTGSSPVPVRLITPP